MGDVGLSNASFKALRWDRIEQIKLFKGNPPLLQGSQKQKRYAAIASLCFGVNPPRAIFWRSLLYDHIHRVANS